MLSNKYSLLETLNNLDKSSSLEEECAYGIHIEMVKTGRPKAVMMSFFQIVMGIMSLISTKLGFFIIIM